MCAGARQDVSTVRVTRYPANLPCKHRYSTVMLTFGSGYLGMRNLANLLRVPIGNSVLSLVTT